MKKLSEEQADRCRRTKNTPSRDGSCQRHRRHLPDVESLITKKAWNALARSLKLTQRELQITKSIFVDDKQAAIAADLGISGHTAHEHFNRLYMKLKVHSRAQLTVRILGDCIV